MSTSSLPLSSYALMGAARPVGGLARQERRLLIAGIAAVHLLAVWALLQTAPVRRALKEAAPLMVSLLSIERPTEPVPALPPPPKAAAAPLQPALPVPQVILAPTAAPQPLAPAPVVAEVPPATPTVVSVSTVPVPPLAPAPPTVRQLPPTAVRYLVPPAIEVPMASRRLGESGTVLLRVLIDVNGLPRQVTLHKSSGHARLDEQALQAMRGARFKPYTENGVAVEGVAIAALQYELD
ncbi:MAG: energy transducer TonB [Burkholderiales bacterium]|nr:energy transducer TonB [Burkholderiales bacterium]